MTSNHPPQAPDSTSDTAPAAAASAAPIQAPPAPNRHNRRADRVKVRKRPAGHAFHDVEVTLTGRIDLINNAEETRRQLCALTRIRPPRIDQSASVRSMFLDIKDITFIEPVALLYVCSELDRLHATGVTIAGNYPRTTGPLQLLRDAGFEEFMRLPQRIPLPLSQASRANVKLMSGTVSELMAPQWWFPLYEFMMVDQTFTPEQADEIYNAFNELVENVRQHAYGTRGGKWYGVALRADTSRPGRIVVLDHGRGITRSLRDLRRNSYQAVIIQLLSSILSATSERDRLIEGGEGLPQDLLEALKQDEWMRVWAATQGLSNSTGRPGRGTGLPSLRSSVERSAASALHVLSGTAAVSYEGLSKPRHQCLTSLRGTAVCLDIGRPLPIETG